MLRGPEVQPVAAVGGGEEVILDHDDDEEPLWRLLIQFCCCQCPGYEAYQDDFAAEKGHIKRGHFAGGLAVVFWEADEEGGAHSPHQACNGHADRYDDFRACSSCRASRCAH